MKGNSGLCLTLAHTFTFALAAHAALGVDLQPSVAPPQPLATNVTWTAKASGDSGATVWYRFRSRALAGGITSAGFMMRRPPAPPDFSVVRDFGPSNTLDWTAAEHEGAYEIEVVARDLSTGETAVAVSRFEIGRAHV